MTYVLPEKLKDLNPYDPVTEDFRIHLDANESFCEVPENIRQEILNAVSNVAFNRYPDPYARKFWTRVIRCLSQYRIFPCTGFTHRFTKSK